MKTLKNKTTAIAISILLIISMSASMMLIPTASAHTPTWTIATQAYVSTVPATLGIGQSVFIVMWSYMKMPQSAINNVLRMQNYRLNITKPDGTTETLGPYTPDPTETTYTSYTPTQIGQYSLVFWYPNTTYIWNDTTVALGGGPGGSTDELAWTNDVFLGSTSMAYNFTVQTTPAAGPINSYPLPTAYWTYPIEGQNTYWYTISSNWLGIGSPQLGTTGLGTVTSASKIQPDGTGPTSAHIMWTKPIQDGGIISGTGVGVLGNQFYTGQSYNQRFPNPIIMQGVLFYQEPQFRAGGDTEGEGPTVAVDLKTGQTLWTQPNMPALSFGFYWDLVTANQQGVLYNGILFSANFAQAFDPRTGNSMFNVTGVPSLTTVQSLPGVSNTALFTSVTVPTGSSHLQSDGSILTDYLVNTGTAANPSFYLDEWNSSNLWTEPSFYPALTTPVNGAAASMYDWNVSLPYFNGPTTGQITELLRAFTDDMALVINGTIDVSNPGYVMWGGWNNVTAPYTISAINLNPNVGAIGSLLWMKTYTAPSGFPNTPVLVWPETIDTNTRVFTMYDTYDMTIYGYSMDTGNQLWGPITQGWPQQPFDAFSGSVSTQNTGSHGSAYGNLYISGYGGVVFCYNDSTGALEWSYGNGGVGNSTQAEYSEPWGNFPTFIAAFAGGFVYVFNNEHSPNTPLYKGPEVRCLNGTTGAEIWTLQSWDDGGQFVANGGAVADGIWVYDNMYDMQIYAIGQGPSQLTVTAPDTAAPLGTPVVIKGTVTDISAGTKQNQQAADFPNGVPCVSDASQSSWMPYVYMQQPEPTNATGVPVTISVTDSNGNTRTIGTATTTSSGTYSLTWTPDISGDYQVIATFAGSHSYWPSSAETSFYATAATATPAPNSAPASNLATTSDLTIGIAAAVIAIIIAIAIVGLLLLRKKP